MKHDMRGFTLVELAIVLVVIALVVAGILTGQSLIRSAELRRVMAASGDYITAVNNFQDKYKSLPGDMPDATSFWTGVTNGDGNGKISTYGTAGTYGERFGAWQQMASAQMIEGTYSGAAGGGGAAHAVIGTNVPVGAVSGTGFTLYFLGVIGAVDADLYQASYGHVLAFGGETAAGPTYGPRLTPEEAFQLDTKMDDGRPNSGTLLAMKSTSALLPNCTTAGNVYNVSDAGALCAVLIKTGL